MILRNSELAQDGQVLTAGLAKTNMHLVRGLHVMSPKPI